MTGRAIYPPVTIAEELDAKRFATTFASAELVAVKVYLCAHKNIGSRSPGNG
jgi:hypothetical protein